MSGQGKLHRDHRNLRNLRLHKNSQTSQILINFTCNHGLKLDKSVIAHSVPPRHALKTPFTHPDPSSYSYDDDARLPTHLL
jgi:hypothetical protein